MNFERIIVNALEAGLGLETVVFALAAIGLNVHFGYTGLLNFGQSAFM
ncbi:MAG TPA: branched-chain amino acid ABC transporter permease, partial [Actinomycetes bacterium]